MANNACTAQKLFAIVTTSKRNTAKRIEEVKMKASKANAIINRSLKGVFMQSMIVKKGWQQLEARSYLVEFTTCKTSLSLKEFMDAK